MSFGRVVWIVVAFALGGVGLSVTIAGAQQTLNDRFAALGPKANDGHLVVDANEIVYDNDKNTVSAVGNVNIYYQGRSLQADRVIYDRNTNRVLAKGNAQLREADGTVAIGEQFELSDDFRNGFINTLHIETAEKTHFSAARAERSEGETTVFSKGTYTACDSCKQDPSRPPFWQVKAARIIHNNTEQMVYYEDARIEFYGVPFAYIPYFSTPDPTVRRKTGFLSPRYSFSSTGGFGLAVPFFWAVAPDYDLTLTPELLSKQGLLGQAEWRQRFLSGSYNVRAAGIFQKNQNVFLSPPYGPQGRDFRGYLTSNGHFDINRNWFWGWNATLVSDKWFLDNYFSSPPFKEVTSTAFLRGRSDEAFFDLSGYYFKPLSQSDWQKQQPIAAPVIDYNRRFKGPGRIGGEVEIDFNFTNLSREAAQYRAISDSAIRYFPEKMPYSTCAVFDKNHCVVNGIGGRYTRLSTSLSWRRDFIDSLGQVWQPFAALRLDAFARHLNTTRFQNSEIGNFLNTDGNDNLTSRVLPTVGFEYRYPLVNHSESWGTHTIEPIAQLVARPNETHVGQIPNEDAQSIVFDHTNLFNWNKFGGYDRAEGGVRANVGLKYSIHGDGGGFAQALFGQSFQIAGRNSYHQYDIAHAGWQSGLDKKRSDYVTGLYIAPQKTLSFLGIARLNEKDFSIKRLDAQVNATFGPLSTGLVFARYAPQPELGFAYRRSGFGPNASLQLTNNWSLKGSVFFDLDRHKRHEYFYRARLSNKNGAAKKWAASNMSLGITYQDECVLFDVTYTSSMKDRSLGAKRSGSAVMMRLELRTLGDIAFSHDVSPFLSPDDTVR